MADRKRLALEGPEQRGLIPLAQVEEEMKKREREGRKRKSRWDEGSYVGELNVGGQLPTNIDVELLKSKEHQEIFLLQLEIREITGRLGLFNLGIPTDPGQRSPSPEPKYNERGVRVNTRLERTKTKLIAQRSNAITKLRGLDPSYFPPAAMGYKCPELEDRVDVPSELFPELNFLGLILGPRGSCLERLRKETRCQITLKGKGTKHNSDGEEEAMHLTISGENREGTKKAGAFLRDLIKTYANDPNGPKMLALRSQRKYEMQVLNGTVREFDTRCANCAATEHRTWQCPDAKNVTPDVICEHCGNAGHPTFDCKVTKEQMAHEGGPPPAATARLDAEYAAFQSDMKGGVNQHWSQQQWESYNSTMGGYMPFMPGGGGVLAAKKEKEKLMLTYDAQQQKSKATASSANPTNAYEQYVQQYANQQQYTQQAYANYVASFTRGKTYVPREPKRCVRTGGPKLCPYHGRAPPHKDPYSGNHMHQHETQAMWKKWYEAHGYNTDDWFGEDSGPAPPLPAVPPADPLTSIFFPGQERQLQVEREKERLEKRLELSLVPPPPPPPPES